MFRAAFTLLLAVSIRVTLGYPAFYIAQFAEDPEGVYLLTVNSDTPGHLHYQTQSPIQTKGTNIVNPQLRQNPPMTNGLVMNSPIYNKKLAGQTKLSNGLEEQSLMYNGLAGQLPTTSGLAGQNPVTNSLLDPLLSLINHTDKEKHQPIAPDQTSNPSDKSEVAIKPPNNDDASKNHEGPKSSDKILVYYPIIYLNNEKLSINLDIENEVRKSNEGGNIVMVPIAVKLKETSENEVQSGKSLDDVGKGKADDGELDDLLMDLLRKGGETEILEELEENEHVVEKTADAGEPGMPNKTVQRNRTSKSRHSVHHSVHPHHI